MSSTRFILWQSGVVPAITNLDSPANFTKGNDSSAKFQAKWIQMDLND
jgi:hypothetical protein